MKAKEIRIISEKYLDGIHIWTGQNGKLEAVRLNKKKWKVRFSHTLENELTIHLLPR